MQQKLFLSHYLDGGLNLQRICPEIYLKRYEHKQLFYDSKTILQEIVQEKGIQPVEYILTGESGPDHDKQFTVSVQVNGQVVGNGTGIQRKLPNRQQHIRQFRKRNSDFMRDT